MIMMVVEGSIPTPAMKRHQFHGSTGAAVLPIYSLRHYGSCLPDMTGSNLANSHADRRHCPVATIFGGRGKEAIDSRLRRAFWAMHTQTTLDRL
jgi:hypothetical protein